MALRLFGFTCDSVRGMPALVLIRTEDTVYLDYSAEILRAAYRVGRLGRDASMSSYRETAKRGCWTYGIVVARPNAASACLELLRRGVKPWADPRRRRAA